MNTKEHLNKIVEKCRSNLLLAEKRTPGRWEASDNVCVSEKTDGYYFVTCDSRRSTMSQDASNAAFIASCAGPAEAGWRATISICDELSRILTTQPWESEGFQWADQYAGEIIAA